VIALMMKAVNVSETTLIDIYRTTQRNIPEDIQLHTLRRESLKSHQDVICPTVCSYCVATSEYLNCVHRYITAAVVVLYLIMSDHHLALLNLLRLSSDQLPWQPEKKNQQKT
jgi:hypothetical protein